MQSEARPITQHPTNTEMFQVVPVISATASEMPHDDMASYVARLMKPSKAVETKRQGIAAAIAIAFGICGPYQKLACTQISICQFASSCIRAHSKMRLIVQSRRWEWMCNSFGVTESIAVFPRVRSSLSSERRVGYGVERLRRSLDPARWFTAQAAVGKVESLVGSSAEG